MSKYKLHLYWGEYGPGSVVELPDDEVRQLLASGLAEEVTEDDPAESDAGSGGTDDDVPEGEADGSNSVG